jgi:hypothetical protein
MMYGYRAFDKRLNGGIGRYLEICLNIASTLFEVSHLLFRLSIAIILILLFLNG